MSKKMDDMNCLFCSERTITKNGFKCLFLKTDCDGNYICSKDNQESGQLGLFPLPYTFSYKAKTTISGKNLKLTNQH